MRMKDDKLDPMTRATRFMLGLLAASAFGALPRSAHAEPPSAKATPVYVLSIWTDDSDDQADALTQALRLRAREAQGWSLAETTQSFETLAIALKCPSKPDPPCLQRIGDQLHADHYVWGTMNKRKDAPGEVKADVHLWTRGKGDAEAVEVYSDNLKDASDESLRAIAARLFGKLTGTGAAGTLVVHAGTGGGSVLVDGAPRAVLDNGVARVDLPSGTHTVSVNVPGFEASSQSASVPIGTEEDMTFTLAPAQPAPESVPASPFPVRKVLGYSSIVAGVGLLVAGGVEGMRYLNDANDNNDLRKGLPTSVTDVCDAAQQLASGQPQKATQACNDSKDAVTASALAWIFGGVGAVLVGTGVWLVATDHGSSEASASAASASSKPAVDVLPRLGLQGGGLDVRVTF
jgi:hypothetical protein